MRGTIGSYMTQIHVETTDFIRYDMVDLNKLFNSNIRCHQLNYECHFHIVL